MMRPVRAADRADVGRSMSQERARKRLTKKAKKGFRGYPVATVAFYGPVSLGVEFSLIVGTENSLAGA